MMRCSAADFWKGDYFAALEPLCLTCVVAAVLCYLIISVKVRFMSKSSSLKEKEEIHGILKSLLVLMLLLIFGWIFNMSMRSLLSAYYPNPSPDGYILKHYTDLVLTFIGIANTFVLYVCRLALFYIFLQFICNNKLL